MPARSTAYGRQVIAAKRENARLKQEQATLQEELEAIMALALEAEAGETAGEMHADSSEAGAALSRQSTAGRPSSATGLAAAINGVVSMYGGSSSSAAQRAASSRSRPATAGPGRQRSKAPAQPVRPWSAAPLQQPGCTAGDTSTPGEHREDEGGNTAIAALNRLASGLVSRATAMRKWQC